MAGVIVGVETYKDMSPRPWVRISNVIILWIFIIEVVVKVIAQGITPWVYWCGHEEWAWNWFDFCIVAVSIPPLSGMLGGGGGVMVLRLFRLARIVKIVNKIPKLKMIIMGLVKGLKSIGYILILLLLVFYIFAITGWYFFAENDPW